MILCLIESVEYVFLVLIAYADTIVGNLYFESVLCFVATIFSFYMILLKIQRDVNPAVIACEFECVRQQIIHYLAHFVTVEVHIQLRYR